MKKSKNASKKACAVTIAVAAAGFLFASEASAAVYTVQLQVNQAQTALEATTRGQCAQDDHPGCVQVGKGQFGDIQFILTGEKSCNKAEGAQWSLTHVYLGGKNSPGKPSTLGGLDAEVLADFDVADAGSGLLNNGNGSNGQRIRITDNNNAAYDIWYTVEADCIVPGEVVLDTLKLDPRVKNVGK